MSQHVDNRNDTVLWRECNSLMHAPVAGSTKRVRRHGPIRLTGPGRGVESHRGVAGCGAHDDFARGRHHAGQATQECAPATGQTLSVHVNQVHGEAARVYAVPRGPLLVLLTAAVRLLAVISPFNRFTLNTVATLCAAAAFPIDPEVVPVSASVVIVPGRFSPSASPSTIAPSVGVTAGSSASADCCVPPGPWTNAPYALPLTDCAGATGASAAVTPISSDSAATTCIARILEGLMLRPVLSRS